MLILNSLLTAADKIDGELILRFDQREKSRLRATLADGEEVAIFTERGTVLRGGDMLRGDDGRIIRVTAAIEATCRIDCADAHALMRCAFHLGNRHTQAQVGDGFLRIRHDPVLKEMLQGLGATVTDEQAAFEPEAGAYGGGHSHRDEHHPLAPIPLRQRIHRPASVADQRED